MKSKRKRRDKWFVVTVIVILAIIAILLFKACDASISDGPLTATERKIERFAERKGYSLEDYPQSLIDLLERNPETEDFVLNYPILKDSDDEIDMSDYENASEVPLLMQWDTRWGYKQYGDDVMGITGCGPTCLSMVAIYLLQDTTYDPSYIADFSVENGHCVIGNGTAWTLMSEGGKQLGMDVTEIPLVEQRIIDNLEVGNPIICIMGPGDFTTTGHFIVMTGYENGKIKVNDPNSIENSEKLWEYEDIKDQIRNLWVFR